MRPKKPLMFNISGVFIQLSEDYTFFQFFNASKHPHTFLLFLLLLFLAEEKQQEGMTLLPVTDFLKIQLNSLECCYA